MKNDEANEEAIEHVQNDLDGALCGQIYDISRQLINERAPFPPAHLITLARYIHVLALRIFNRYTHPEGAEGWTFDGDFRYEFFRYLATVFKLNAAVATAIKCGDLQLRDRSTGLVMDEWSVPKTEIADMLERAIYEGDDRTAAEILVKKWPVLAPHFWEDIAISKSEFLGWAERQGIAEPGEIENLNRGLSQGKWLRTVQLGFPQDIDALLEGLWPKTPQLPEELVNFEASNQSDIGKGDSIELSSPLQRGEAQEQSILAALRKMGYSPRALPKREQGKAGPKAQVRELLCGEKNSGQHVGFSSNGVFDKAWERLRGRGEIGEVSENQQ